MLTSVMGDKAIMRIYGEIKSQDLMFQNDINVLENETKIRKIEMYINSSGGNVVPGFALIDLIDKAELNGFQIEAIACGTVQSMAVPIFLSVDTRFAGVNTLFMVHELFSRDAGDYSNKKANMKMMEMRRIQYFKILTDNSNLKKDVWEKMEEKTTWFTVKQAKKWGMIK